MINLLSNYGFRQETIDVFSRSIASFQNGNIIFDNLKNGFQVFNEMGFFVCSGSTLFVLNVYKDPIVKTVYYFSNFIEAMYFYENRNVYNLHNSVFVIIRNFVYADISLILQKYKLANRHNVVFCNKYKNPYIFIDSVLLTMYIKKITNISYDVKGDNVIFVINNKIHTFEKEDLKFSIFKKKVSMNLTYHKKYISWINQDINYLDQYNIIKKDV